MTEEEWLSSEDAYEMLKYLPDAATERKHMAFAAVCCMRIMTRATDARLQMGIQAVERLSEGNIQSGEIQAAIRCVWEFYSSQLENRFDDPACSAVLEALERDTRHWSSAVSSHVKCAIVDPLIERGASDMVWVEEQREQCRIVRDIFGNPFRPVAFAPEWRSEAAVGIASQMYDSRDFGNMPILADALQDAGCELPDVLNHCREPGTHVRGCWVVDLVLGKS